ncbi:ABC transporter transmembrane domain-containing protein [Sphingobacterium hotanense]|uniref:ABC transporter transmembrane domain-containing protein n=1 Tax=Sphingobacterium hotanense TaxID=649196 RepID=UPI0011F2B78A|nr:ABC transporter ATP-binding protein [Sphingobacterium hotanense]
MMNRQQLSWILNFSNEYKYKLLSYFLFEIFSLIFSFSFIWYSKLSIDAAVGGQTESLSGLLVITALSMLLSFACSQLASYLNERNKALMLVDLQKQILQKQVDVRWEAQKKHTGDLMVRLLNDTQEIVTAVAQTIIACMVSLIKIIAATWFLCWMDPWLAAVLLLITPFLLFSKFFFRKLRTLQKSLKNAESQLGKTIQDNLRLRLLIRSMNQDKQRWQHVEHDQNEIYQIKRSLINFSTFSKGIWGGVFSLSYIVAFVWGIQSLNAGLITVGTMSAFLQLVIRIQSPAAALIGNLPSLIRFSSAVDRVEEILKETVEERVEPCFLKDLVEVKLSNLALRVDGNLLVTNLDFTFKIGVPSVVFGASGLGKSTILRAILGLLNPVAGAIVLKNQSLFLSMSPAYRCNFAFVPQGEKIFNGTIRNNLLFGTDGCSDERLYEALEIACANFVFDLPLALETMIGESGFGLSEGQIQRLAVARAILQPARAWVFDEVTSALDQETAHALVRNLIQAGRDKIIIFVTHDISLSGYFENTLNLTKRALLTKK